MFRVLVVEDSAVHRALLIHLLESDPLLSVIATASNGEEAVLAAQNYLPDVITMDINMPRMDGFEATRRIMESTPRPIVIVTANWNPKEVATSFRAMEAGAVAVIAKPPGIGHPDYDSAVRELVQTVKNMAEIKVVRRWPRIQPVPRANENGSTAVAHTIAHTIAHTRARPNELRLVVIGASTGGPMALQSLLAALPHPLPVPVVVVQHMAAGFISGFAGWMQQSTGHPVRVATDGESILPGTVYVAPDGFQMRVTTRGKVELTTDGVEYGVLPSVSYLFRSVAQNYGAHALGILLTGMGRDGAAELKMMRDVGAITFVQDKESSVIHGMPGEAIRLDAAVYVLPPEGIARALRAIWNQQALPD